jgi:hypothetical protein
MLVRVGAGGSVLAQACQYVVTAGGWRGAKAMNVYRRRGAQRDLSRSTFRALLLRLRAAAHTKSPRSMPRCCRLECAPPPSLCTALHKFSDVHGASLRSRAFGGRACTPR